MKDGGVSGGVLWDLIRQKRKRYLAECFLSEQAGLVRYLSATCT